MTRRDTIHGWRWDLVSPLGLGSPYTTSVGGFRQFIHRAYSEPTRWHGWYKNARASCNWSAHIAPRPDCICGIHLVDPLTHETADRIAGHEAAVELAGEPAIGLMLSRVTAQHAIPGVDPKDPPHTWRARRLQYVEWFVNNEWLAEGIAGDDRLEGFPPVNFVPDLAQFVRARVNADLDTQIDAYIDDYLKEETA